MDLNKKSRPSKNDIQTFKLNVQGFKKKLNENPPSEFFFMVSPIALGIEPATVGFAGERATDVAMQSKGFQAKKFQ